MIIETKEQSEWVISGALLEFAADGEFELVCEIIDVYLSDTQEKVEALGKVVPEFDAVGARRLAHSLKGSARQMGTLRFGDDLEKLEHCVAGVNAAELSALVQVIEERWIEVKREVNHTRQSMTRQGVAR